ncbi:MAG TPA: hypothetical protein VHE34_11580 [Puia sp.]|uniref:hypothetical protein n=1 Tax=Puia sp. TaxID=2045100 RepID=UPI002CBB9B26|nr:hypothetical protein [Puia sp.]HVU95860.1 hypothetical protein [Puia sp.]
MEKTITKDLLRNELYSDGRPAGEMLYSRYSGMLYSYILQFVPEAEAGTLLVDIFVRLTPQLNEAFDSSLSVYCWLQIESRKMILEHLRKRGDVAGKTTTGAIIGRGPGTAVSYFSLLEDAPPEHQWVFREVFLYGRSKEELAQRSGKDLAYVSQLLRECLGMIRKSLG